MLVSTLINTIESKLRISQSWNTTGIYQTKYCKDTFLV